MLISACPAMAKSSAGQVRKLESKGILFSRIQHPVSGIQYHSGVMPMDDDLKRNIKKMTEKTEIKLTESLLRWKYKKEGKEIPADQNLEFQSRQVMRQAHKTFSKRGKNIWNEFKKAYRKKGVKKEQGD